MTTLLTALLNFAKFASYVSESLKYNTCDIFFPILMHISLFNTTKITQISCRFSLLSCSHIRSDTSVEIISFLYFLRSTLSDNISYVLHNINLDVAEYALLDININNIIILYYIIS